MLIIGRKPQRIAIVLTLWDRRDGIIDIVELPADTTEEGVKAEIDRARRLPRVSRVTRNDVHERR
ncbi:MAG: hypothetical protein OJF48_003437 [Afipia sp.]|jgi:hypothetical protein|nr:MAG: hypothetical protein OJF48_003437 [Afipia sp.]